MQKRDPQQLSDILKSRQPGKKPPTYEWQDLALRIIKELGIPNFKKSAVFKVCKEKPKQVIEIALNDTKELCQAGERWKYFFKIISEGQTNNRNNQ